MNALIYRTLSLFLSALVVLGYVGELTLGQDTPSQPPNIVVIYADDLGYGDVSCYNPRRGKIHAPHIDRLASQGMAFTDAHSSSGVCSPSRYTLLTGRYHWRTRLQKGIVGLWGAPLIAEDRLTLAGLLRGEGYQTACIGKWHLGWQWPIAADDRTAFQKSKAASRKANEKHQAAWRRAFSQPIAAGPTTRGFDSYFGTDVPNWPPFCFIRDDRTVGVPSEFLPPRWMRKHQASIQGPAVSDWNLQAILPALRDEACRYIAEAAQRDAPYFLYLPLTSPHTPLAVNPQWQGKSGLKNPYADLVMETDAIVGDVLRAIEETGEEKQTVVIFTSDNGCAPYIGAAQMEAQGHFPSGPLRGYKSDVWEGGQRVPMIVRWPGVVAAGSSNDQLVHQADLMATFAEIVDVELQANQGEDSFSLLLLWQGADKPVRETAVNQSIRGLLAIRHGDWKLIFGRGSGGWTDGQDEHPGQLYDLANDLGETTNLYAQQPKMARQLNGLMQKIVERGRSNTGPDQANDVKVNWQPLTPTDNQ